MKSTLALVTLCLASLTAGAADVQLTEIVRTNDGIVISWTAEIGQRYEVQSASFPSGPWRTRDSVQPAAGLAQWTEREPELAPQQFYRLAVIPSAPAVLSTTALLAGDFVPRQAVLLGEQSGEVVANGVFLASQLGAGGLQLVTTGTLAQQGPNWTYSSSPSDRLVVHYATGTNVDFYISRMQGDFSVDATTFLRRNHALDYRVAAPGVGDLTFTSDVGTGTPTFRATSRGSLVVNGLTYTVDLTLAGQYQFEIDSSGSSLLNDYLMTGTVSAPAYHLTVNQRRRFELVTANLNSRSDIASADQDWYNNTLVIGPDTYQWVNATKQKSFKNGKPSSIDTYWKASGGVLKNGQPFGAYEMRADAVLGYLRFYLVLPDQLIELESWNALL